MTSNVVHMCTCLKGGGEGSVPANPICVCVHA